MVEKNKIVFVFSDSGSPPYLQNKVTFTQKTEQQTPICSFRYTGRKNSVCRENPVPSVSGRAHTGVTFRCLNSSWIDVAVTWLYTDLVLSPVKKTTDESIRPTWALEGNWNSITILAGVWIIQNFVYPKRLWSHKNQITRFSVVCYCSKLIRFNLI